MKKCIKKVVSIVLALCIVFSTMSMSMVAMAETSSYQEIHLDTPVRVTVTNENPSSCFLFIPEESGVYFFSSSGSEDTYGQVLDENKNVLESDDDGGENSNFKVSAQLIAGQTYILESRLYSYESGSFTVVIEKSNIQSVDFDDISITEWNSEISYDYNFETGEQDLEWTHYSYSNKVSGTITYTDGTTDNIENGYYVDGSRQNIYYNDNQNYSSQWTVGNSYEVTATLYGITTTFTVYVAEAPKIVSVTTEPINIMEYTNGSDYGDYYYYDLSASDTKVTVTLEDGTVLSNTDKWGNIISSSISYNDESFHIGFSIEQSAENPLLPGNTYIATVSVLGTTCTLPVTILAAPKAVSVTAEPITIMEGTNGYDAGGYFYYNLSAAQTTVTVTLEDGTVLSNTDKWGSKDSSIFYNDESFHIGFSIEQSAENPSLLPGNTYYATISILGATCTVPVTILEAPKAVSVTAEPITIMEYTNGSYYDDYYHYDLSASDTKVTVTLDDGTVLYNKDEWGDPSSSIYYGDESFEIDFSIEQSAENPLLPGNTYYATISILGATCTVPVTILEAPKAVSVTAEPITIMEGTNGSDYDDYYHYDLYAYDTKVTVTLDDGTVLYNKNEWGNPSSSIYYGDESFYIDISIEQSAENPLLPGNTYIATVSVLGTTCTLPVTILEAPKAESVTAEPITIIEGTNGSDYGDYYYYDLSASDTKVTVTLEDGTVLSNTDKWGNIISSSISYNDESFHIGFSIEQSAENPLLPGNTYNATISVLGATCTIPVTITKSPVKSIEVLDVKPVYTCDYSHISEGTPIYNTPDFNLKVNFENGDYIILRGGAGVSSDNQHVTPWTVGGENLVTVSYMGKTTQFSVQLVEKNAKLFEYEVQDGVAYITGCNNSAENLEIPSEIDGYPVKGILSLGWGLDAVKEISIPDSVTYFSAAASYGLESLEIINLGSSVEEVGYWHFYLLENLKSINVSANNKNYASVDGVLYNKNIDKIVFYPPAKEEEVYIIPSTVIDFSVLYEDIYTLNIEFAAGNEGYALVDDVVYTKDMKMVLYCNPEKTGEYVMPETVTSIAKGAFSNSSLSKITVSSKVTEIVYNTFEYTSNLETVILPSNLKRIEPYAFYASGISSITLPNGLEEIGESAFEAASLDKIEIPGSVKNISHWAFYSTAPSEIIINEGVESIGYYVFSNSGNNVEAGQLVVHLPNTLKTIGDGAFYDRHDLAEITIPASVTDIGYEAFAKCEGLKTVNLLGSGITLDECVFKNSPIENFDFDKVSGKIWRRTFENSNLTSVVFPETVTEISYGAFENSKYLEEVDFPETIITLDPDAFEGTPWYDNVYSTLDDGWVIYDNVFMGCKGNYNSVKDTAPVLPEGVTSIVSDSMQFATFSSIELPKSLRVIGIGAFQYNKNLSSIYIPENVEYIADTAFYACSSLSDIQVAENNPYYTAKDGVLYNKDMTKLIFCGKQESGVFRVPSTVKNIAEGAFYTSGVKYIIFENSNVSLDNNNYNTGYGEELSVQQTIDGITFDEALPILVCDKSADSKIYAFAQERILYTIDINSLTAESIELEGTPKTMFNVGDKFVQDDLKLKVNYNEFSELLEITPKMVSDFDSSKTGVQTVTITYSGLETTLKVTVSGTATVSSKTARPGSTFDVIVKLDTPVDCTSVAISNISYDTSKVELISGEWLAEGLIIKNWDSAEKLGAAAFQTTDTLNGNLIKLRFKVKDDVEDGNFNINCELNVRLDDIDIPFTVNSGSIKIANVLPGDLNGDDSVTDADAMYLLMHTFFADTYPANQECDFNGDEKVTDADAVYLLMHTFFQEDYPLN